jgi:3-oxoacyl-[acyl-carrier-protein] synthase-1
MSKVYIGSSNIITSLGWNTQENLESVLAGRGGIKITKDRQLSDSDFPASLIDFNGINNRFSELAPSGSYTRFEKLSILSLHDTISQSGIGPDDTDTVFILCSTKGNVELLSDLNGFDRERLLLWKSAELIARFFGMKQAPLVVSNACISGVVGMIMAMRLIRGGKYKRALVCGADVLSKFIVSGFQSFQSLSPLACRPFDKDRDGLSLGEGVGTLLISKEPGGVELLEGAISNDANHISGPSRTGEGLLVSIQNTLQNHGVDFISAHGTATPYNDDMESIAFARAGLEQVPANSLKGYFGHTLGAAGIIESIINMEAMKKDTMIGTLGLSEVGLARDMNLVDQSKDAEYNTILKTASGFGGCNASVLLRKS